MSKNEYVGKSTDELVEKFSKMPRGQRSFEYLKLSDAGVDDTIAGILAFSTSGETTLAEDIKNAFKEQ